MNTKFGLRGTRYDSGSGDRSGAGRRHSPHVHNDLRLGERTRRPWPAGSARWTATIVPFFGTNYIVEAFVTVIVGGANALVGTPLAAALLGAINAVLGTQYGLYIGRVGLLLTTILIIRVLPDGISGLVQSSRTRTSRVKSGEISRAAAWLKAENITFAIFFLFFTRSTRRRLMNSASSTPPISWRSP